MKRVIALALAVALLCSLTPALAYYVPKHIDEYDNLPYMPSLSSFAAMRTRQVEEIVTIYLDREVDNLRANWLEYNNEHEEPLEVNEELMAFLDTTGHKYQVGAHWTNAYATETYTENTLTAEQKAEGLEERYQTMLRDSDAQEGKDVGDTMAERNTLREVNSSSKVSATTPEKKNDSYENELKGYLYNDQPDKFEKHEIPFSYNPNNVSGSNAQIEATIDTFKKIANQEAQSATDALGQRHYDQYGSRADLYNYYCVKVQEPYYAVVKKLDDGKFCILSRYGRNGKIQYFYIILYDTEFFGYDLGTAKIQFEPCNAGWYIREITETYEDGSYISAYYNRTGNGKLSYYRTEGIFED